ncbi:MAG: sulfatase, partial [Planctomycetes bacterium]|nr:sulfatase [Planctomycetota bacterium]
VASIMTSLYPASHRTNQLKIKIPDSLTTLAETMGNAGYSTAGFSANRNVSEIFGFAQGFDSFWAHSSNELNSMLRFTSWERLRDTLAKRTGIGKKKKSPVASSADVMNEHALQWLAEDRAPDAPWFLYLQYIDPHGPYSPPQDFLDEIGVPLIAKDVLQKIGGTSQEPPFPFGAQPEVEKDLLDGIVRLYDAEIQFTDRHIGRLLDNLRSQGLLNNTYVILTSDHGEEFGEHQQFGHGQSTFDELSRIPLIIAGPGIEPGVSKTPVELIDLYPTMATWASAPQPANLQGRDLAPLLAGGDEGARSGFVQNLKSSTLTCLVVGNEKLIQVKHGDQEAWMLFNLKDDPLEQNDLASAQPDRVQHLRDLLEERRVQSEEFRVDTVNSIDITGTVAQDLSDLGYFETEE